MKRRTARKFSVEFKKQMVELYNSGKPSGEIIREYDLTSSRFYAWVRQYKEQHPEPELDRINESQQNKQQETEIRVLKQAAFIVTQG